MGLDMYLHGILSHYRMHDYNIGNVEMRIEIGYWRKANAIHKWFVDNCQDGVDNCAVYYVSKERLEELKEICEEVLKDLDKGEELLPTQSGFFFGDTGYNENYKYDLEETIKICKWALNKEFDYYEYHSSW